MRPNSSIPQPSTSPEFSIRSPALPQVAANALIEAVCGLPAWSEMTTINRETMRRAGAGAALVPLLSSACESLRIAAFSITAGCAPGIPGMVWGPLLAFAFAELNVIKSSPRESLELKERPCSVEGKGRHLMRVCSHQRLAPAAVKFLPFLEDNRSKPNQIVGREGQISMGYLMPLSCYQHPQLIAASQRAVRNEAAFQICRLGQVCPGWGCV